MQRPLFWIATSLILIRIAKSVIITWIAKTRILSRIANTCVLNCKGTYARPNRKDSCTEVQSCLYSPELQRHLYSPWTMPPMVQVPVQFQLKCAPSPLYSFHNARWMHDWNHTSLNESNVTYHPYHVSTPPKKTGCVPLKARPKTSLNLGPLLAAHHNSSLPTHPNTHTHILTHTTSTASAIVRTPQGSGGGGGGVTPRGASLIEELRHTLNGPTYKL